MRKREFRYWGIVILVICIYLYGCSEKEYKLISGSYYAQSNADAIVLPVISFDCESCTFQFSFDPASSYLCRGMYEILDGKIIATTSDNKYIYVFEIVDEKIIKFVENESSKVIVTEGGAPVTDGMIFEHE